MAEFKDRLYELMSIKNLSRADIVEKTGISKALISMYLNGKRIPKQDNLYTLATAYNVKIEWLMGYDVPITNFDIIKEDSPQNYDNPNLKKLYLLCSDLTEEQIKIVIQYVEFLLSKNNIT